MNKLQKALKDNGILQWQAAEYIGMREDAFSRMMRHELPEEKRKQLLAVIIEKHKKGGAE